MESLSNHSPETSRIDNPIQTQALSHGHSSMQTQDLSHSHSPIQAQSSSHSPIQAQDPLQMHAHHTHGHQQTQAVLNRMSRAIGHMEAVKRMAEDGRDCSEILIQIAAVRSAINNIGKLILEDHISHCIVDAVEHGDNQALEDLKNAIEKFIK